MTFKEAIEEIKDCMYDTEPRQMAINAMLRVDSIQMLTSKTYQEMDNTQLVKLLNRVRAVSLGYLDAGD